MVRCVETRLIDYRGRADAETLAAARRAGYRAELEVGRRVRALLELDIDAQTTTPLSVLRDAVRYPSEVLEEAGVPPVERDDFAEERFPDDPYDLTPATFTDIDPALGELGLAWGAAKAWTHKRRHGGKGGATPEGEEPAVTRVAAYVPDLMDRSRLTGVGEVTFVSAPGDLAAVGAEVVVVDLSRPGVLDAVGQLGTARTIGFGSHVDTELLEAARAAGVDEVLPRSRFFARVVELLGGKE